MAKKKGDRSSRNTPSRPSRPEIPKPEEPKNLPTAEEVLNAIPEDERPKMMQMILQQHSHTGPLPPSSEVGRYEEIMPGFADRLMKQVEKQSTHRQNQESTLIRRQLNQTSTGQWLGAFLTTLLICSGVFLSYIGQTTTANVIFSVTIIGLATVFITGRRNDKAAVSNDDDKDKP